MPVSYQSLKPILVLVLFLFASTCQSPKEEQESNIEPIIDFTLDELQKRTFGYFWELADQDNYQIPDRFPSKTFSSIAATGFGLTSYLVGVERGYITRQQAVDRVLNTLRVLYQLPQGEAIAGSSGHKGFFYHFLSYHDATRFKEVELSSIDSALLMAGILAAQSYFDKEKNKEEEEIRTLAENLYRRVEWDWMMTDEDVLSMGWKPESGFLEYSWKGYSEAMILYILALGSPTHSIPADTWKNWTKTYKWEEFGGQTFVNFSPLFVHQYSHIYIDFRGIQDDYMQTKGIDYFENSKRATYANRAYCIKNPRSYIGYKARCWGLTACDGPGYKETTIGGKKWTFDGYSARGASSVYINDDGTIAPTAVGGSIPFAPEICLPALEFMWKTYYNDLVGKYGFKDAFNLSWENGEGWFDKDYLGIDQGPILLQAENCRTELVWNIMKKNPHIIAGMKKAGFSGGWINEK